MNREANNASEATSGYARGALHPKRLKADVRSQKMNEEKQRFTPRRVAWVTAFMSLLLIPCHFFVSCDLSGRLAMSGIGLVVITGLFSLADRTGRKALPFGLAMVGLVGHTLCTH